ncbi:MAG: hypothetical protein ACD_76C00106G0038 [uncultured bacterium]|nr:MAG: hypothetical protein ACD_76C00106G0038 [uncultured bacterium]HBD05561.1 hypothetical protein [Candidatus Uhrbacteria bacterium]
MDNDLLNNLNENQKEAVLHKNGPLMILAGAGTGKTTVITRRIAWLISNGFAKPEEILALTFTEKAAEEMEERVDQLLPIGYIDIQISTFHSFCEKILRDCGAEIGLASDFKLMTELGAWLITRQNFDKFKLDYYKPMGNPTKFLKGLLKHISRAKDENVSPDDYIKFAESIKADSDSNNSDESATEESKRICELADFYHSYQRILQENDSVDFGDLIMYALLLFKKRPRVLEQYRNKFEYILVDEFQDTNWAQYELIKMLASPKNNLTVVGDDDQSIYKFRGASLSNILSFENDYKDAKRVILTDNYRTLQNILDRAYDFIQQNNPNRLEVRVKGSGISKKLVSSRQGNGIVEHIHAKTIDEEASSVIKRMLELKNKDVSWGDFCILARANDTAMPFISELEKNGIPFQFLALKGLYSKPVIIDSFSVLRIADNPHDSPSFYRILCHNMYSLPSKDIATILNEANKKARSIFEVLEIGQYSLPIEKSTHEKITKILNDMRIVSEFAKTKKASEAFVLATKQFGIVDFVASQEDKEIYEQFRHLQQFYERIKDFESRALDASLHNFLQEYAIELASGEDGSVKSDITQGPDTVKIMTVHGSKGLEFKYVFVVSLIDQRFPSVAKTDAIPLPESLIKECTQEGNMHLEEERRLFYVALTRARDGVFLTSASEYGGARKRKLSRFLTELGFKSAPNEQDSVGIFEEDESATEIKQVFEYSVPKHFSFTQLAAYTKCPLQYKFAHVFHIPVFGKFQMSYGKSVHSVFEKLFKLILERSSVKQGELFSGVNSASNEIKITDKEFDEILNSSWIDEWYPDRKASELYFDKYKKTLIKYYESLKENKPNTIAVEVPFTVKIGACVIKGQIDRIDAVEGGVEIIDYKTGSPKTIDGLAKEDKRQLFLYQIAASEILGLKPVKLTYFYTEDSTCVSFIGKDKDIDELKETVKETIAEIKKCKFKATPGFQCQFCDFKDICDERQL